MKPDICIRRSCSRRPHKRSEFGYCASHAAEQEPTFTYVPAAAGRSLTSGADRTLRQALWVNTKIWPCDTAGATVDAWLDGQFDAGAIPSLSELDNVRLDGDN